jgi:3-dehydro-L-gulonate 2-dehydrogenase
MGEIRTQMRVTYKEMFNVMRDCLRKHGVDEDIACACARNVAENSLCGVYSHGLNRFPRIISMINNGLIKPNNRPDLVSASGAFEVWDGKLGMGNTNAIFCMDKAVELAKKYGVGGVVLRHTNNWLRGGSFGIRAAASGCAAICWSTTTPNMPVWGGADRRIGNNPLALCVPYGNSFVLFDGSMSQFSYETMEEVQLEKKKLAVAGGYDELGNLTTDPVAIAKTWRTLPIGFWKGSGLSILMDVMASTLSDGKPVYEIGKQDGAPEDEYNLNQVFIALKITAKELADSIIGSIIADIKSSSLADGFSQIFYPGEQEKLICQENKRIGIPVNKYIWNRVKILCY